MAAVRTTKAAAVKKRGVVSTPGVCGGRPRIAGTRISLETLLRCREVGFTDKRILEGYPALGQEDLAAAWKWAEAQ
jgi:uncharacterized protein (DUF433 family)